MNKKYVPYLVGGALLLIAFLTQKASGMNLADSSTASTIEDSYSDFVNMLSQKWGIPASRIYAHIFTESHGATGATGSAGERGLMQLKPDALTDANKFAGTDFTFDQMYNAYANLSAGVAYLALMLHMVQSYNLGGLDEASQAYNAGFHAFQLDKTKGLAYLQTVKTNENLFS